MGINNVSSFLVLLAHRIPNMMFRSMADLLVLFNFENYRLRTALAEIIGIVVHRVLTEGVEEIEEAEKRVHFARTKEKLL